MEDDPLRPDHAIDADQERSRQVVAFHIGASSVVREISVGTSVLRDTVPIVAYVEHEDLDGNNADRYRLQTVQQYFTVMAAIGNVIRKKPHESNHDYFNRYAKDSVNGFLDVLSASAEPTKTFFAERIREFAADVVPFSADYIPELLPDYASATDFLQYALNGYIDFRMRPGTFVKAWSNVVESIDRQLLRLLGIEHSMTSNELGASKAAVQSTYGIPRK